MFTPVEIRGYLEALYLGSWLQMGRNFSSVKQKMDGGDMSNHNAGTWKHLEIIMEDYGVSYPPISEGFYPCRDAFDSRVVVETVTNLEA